MSQKQFDPSNGFPQTNTQIHPELHRSVSPLRKYSRRPPYLQHPSRPRTSYNLVEISQHIRTDPFSHYPPSTAQTGHVSTCSISESAPDPSPSTTSDIAGTTLRHLVTSEFEPSQSFPSKINVKPGGGGTRL